jgi:hypothetical protein
MEMVEKEQRKIDPFWGLLTKESITKRAATPETQRPMSYQLHEEGSARSKYELSLDEESEKTVQDQTLRATAFEKDKEAYMNMFSSNVFAFPRNHPSSDDDLARTLFCGQGNAYAKSRKTVASSLFQALNSDSQPYGPSTNAVSPNRLYRPYVSKASIVATSSRLQSAESPPAHVRRSHTHSEATEVKHCVCFYSLLNVRVDRDTSYTDGSKY